ncbi:unannotated protein [freshwater metagenome]|uniref:Unannotated protein n=1 Tax=freshwater metagenome TaxID=449393 RepID=A0A6J5YFD0_9ZZZZ
MGVWTDSTQFAGITEIMSSDHGACLEGVTDGQSQRCSYCQEAS